MNVYLFGGWTIVQRVVVGVTIAFFKEDLSHLNQEHRRKLGARRVYRYICLKRTSTSIHLHFVNSFGSRVSCD